MIKATTLFLAMAAMLPIASYAAGTGPNVAVSARTFSGTLSPQQRGAAIATFVRRWGSYVASTYGIDVYTWSKRMVPQFASGDAVNIQRALTRTTFEGAMAELDGVGHKLSDDQAITRLAKAQSDISVESLGSTANDLVFTPVTPCRIVDTRLAGGTIAASSSRGFGVWGFSSYTFQGGSATNCGLFSESPEAVVLNVTVVGPGAAGYATVYPANAASRPNISSINYTTGAVVNNTVVTPLGTLSANDMQIYTVAQAHYVVDIVGFYDAPHATALDTQKMEASYSLLAGASGGSFSPDCPATYTLTGGGCGTSATDGFVVRSEPSGTHWWCYAHAGAGATTAYSWAQCSRVPGR
jgi:hypothetical protein